jgi:translation elongation factor EF-1alpha
MSGNNIQSFYEEISNNLHKAINELNELPSSGTKVSSTIQDTQDKLRNLQKKFDDELQFLKQNSEWNEFAIAFFGETNAGKSTIIESLRILLNDPSREELLKLEQKEKMDLLEKYDAALNRLKNSSEQDVINVYAEIESIKKSIKSLQKSKIPYIVTLIVCMIGSFFIGVMI